MFTVPGVVVYEGEKVCVHTIRVGDEETVGSVFVDDERLAGHEPGRLATTEVDGGLHITVAVDDQRRDSNCLQIGAEIAGESGQEERGRGPQQSSPGTVES